MAMILNRFWTALALQHDRWILWSPVPLALGIACYFSLKTEPSYLLGPVLLGFFIILCGAFYRNRQFLPLWIALFLVLAGFTAGQWRTHQMAAPALQKKTYPVLLSGRIALVDPLPQANRVVLDDIKLVSGRIWQDNLPERVRIRLKRADKTEPRAGDRVEIKAVLLPLSGPVLPGAFDFQRYAFFEGLGATGYAIGDLTVTEAGGQGFYFEKLRRIIRDRIEQAVEDKGHAGLLAAFIIGESHGIPEDIWNISRLSGIAHLIAISGSHFVMVAGFPFFLIRALLAAISFIALRFPVKKIAAVGAIAASVFYMFLIGSPIPAQRAVISVTVVMLAIIIDRDPFTLRLASFSALLILLLEPESLLGASFQLSFAAIVGLISFYEATRDWWREKFREPNIIRRWSFFLIGCFMTTMIASTVTAPFALYNFSRISLLAGWVANMVAVPLSSFVTFPAALLGCLLMPFGLEHLPLKIAERSLDIIMAVASEVITWPYASVTVNAWSGGLLAMITLGGLWFCLWKGRIRLIGLVPVALAIVMIPLTPRPDILISETGRLSAIRGEDGLLWLSSARVEKFMRKEWVVREGSAGSAFWPTRKDDAPLDWITCADDTCRISWRGHDIIAADGKVEEGPCPDMLITSSVIEYTCPSRTMIFDKKYLRASGTVALYRDGETGAFTIRSALAERGQRPWVIQPRPWRSKADYLKDRQQERAAQKEGEPDKTPDSPLMDKSESED